MRLAAILVLCLAFAVHQSRAAPSIFDAINKGVNAVGSIAGGAAGAIGSIAGGTVEAANGFAKGVINTATAMSKGAIGVGTGAVSSLTNIAESFTQGIENNIKNVKSKALQTTLREVQATLQQIKVASTELLQTSEIAGQKVKSGVIELESRQEESINVWADNAKNRLADASEDAQIKGQDLIDGFANERSEDLKECSDKIVSELEQLQEKANITAKRIDEPMSKLVQQVGKCAELKANDIRRLSGCAADTSKLLQPLLAVPGQLEAVKVDIIKVGLQSLPKNVCVAATLTKFRLEAIRVDKEIDQLIAKDKKKAEEEAAPKDEPNDRANPEEKTTPAGEHQNAGEKAPNKPSKGNKKTCAARA